MSGPLRTLHSLFTVGQMLNSTTFPGKHRDTEGDVGIWSLTGGYWSGDGQGYAIAIIKLLAADKVKMVQPPPQENNRNYSSSLSTFIGIFI